MLCFVAWCAGGVTDATMPGHAGRCRSPPVAHGEGNRESCSLASHSRAALSPRQLQQVTVRGWDRAVDPFVDLLQYAIKLRRNRAPVEERRRRRHWSFKASFEHMEIGHDVVGHRLLVSALRDKEAATPSGNPKVICPRCGTSIP